MASSIAILDYGMGNLRSVQKGFAQIGAESHIISRGEELDRFDKVILPGIGAFKDAMATLRARNLDSAILRHVQRGKLLLGICLGQQLIFDVSFEDGEHTGLGIIPGKVVRFDVDMTLNLKVPHMGWNQLEMRTASPLMKGLPSGSSVYFVHSYHTVPNDKSTIASETDYGRPFASSLWRDNVLAAQFHPEKSQKVGLKMLENFAAM